MPKVPNLKIPGKDVSNYHPQYTPYQDDLDADDNATDPLQDDRGATTDTTMPPDELEDEFKKQDDTLDNKDDPEHDDLETRIEDSDENIDDPPGDKIV